MGLLLDLLDALPSTLAGLTVKAYPNRATPETADLAWPHVRVSIMGDQPGPGTVTAEKRFAQETTAVTGETHTYTDGDDFTLLDERDAAALTSVTATAYQDATTGDPVAGPLVEDRDYELSASGTTGDLLDSINWLTAAEGAVVLPADASTVTVSYTRYQFQGQTRIRRRPLAMCVVHAIDGASPKEDIAYEVGRSLQAWVAVNNGLELSTGATIGVLETARIGPNDAADSMSTYVVTFRIEDNRLEDLGTPIRRVGTAPITTNTDLPA